MDIQSLLPFMCMAFLIADVSKVNCSSVINNQVQTSVYSCLVILLVQDITMSAPTPLSPNSTHHTAPSPLSIYALPSVSSHPTPDSQAVTPPVGPSHPGSSLHRPLPPPASYYLLCQREEQHQGAAWFRDGGQLLTLEPHHIHKAPALIHSYTPHQLQHTARTMNREPGLQRWHVWIMSADAVERCCVVGDHTLKPRRWKWCWGDKRDSRLLLAPPSDFAHHVFLLT